MILSVQFLRFVAAALVVLTHVRLEFDKVTPDAVAPFGAFGVDVFFVISGFIMSHVTERHPEGFLQKRLIRIVPLYWAFTLLLAGVALALPSLLNSASFDPAHLIASLLFFPLWTNGTEFKPILMLGWTLNYEMYFYLLFYIAMRIDHRRREYVCAAMLLGVCLALSALAPDARSVFLFHADTIALEFIFGMLLSLAYRHRRAFRRGLPVPLAAVLILASLGAFLVTGGDPAVEDSLSRFVVWGVPAAVLVFAVIGLERYSPRADAAPRRTLLLLGELSYPLYLVHVYVIAVLSRVLGVTGLGLVGFFAVSLVLASIVSWLALAFYDVPVRQALNKRFMPARTSIPPRSAP